MKEKELGFSTQAIHGKYIHDQYGALNTPIYQTSTFVFDDADQGGRRFALEEEGFIYTRLGNPTVRQLEVRLADLEKAEACVAFSSGMGAIASVIWSSVKAGDHIVADKTLYGCTFALLSHGVSSMNVEITFVEAVNLAEVQAAMRPNTKLVYIESPCNPTLKLVDIEEVAKIAHTVPECKLMVDNTFATPYITQPLTIGADVVVHSGTKYLNGHGDVICGFAMGSKEFMTRVRYFGLKDMTGAVMSPFDAFLVLRGLKTLAVRMDVHCANAAKVADFLAHHDKIAVIYYPGLESFAQKALAEKQMRFPGAMIAFEVKGGLAQGKQLVNALKICRLAVSLGDTETLISHPASMTHSPYTPEERAIAGISENLIRISVGLENVEDIIADLEQSLALI